MLVTRPLREARTLCERLQSLGHSGLIDPLLTVQFLDPPMHRLEDCQAVLVTSRNALHSVDRNPKRLAVLAKKRLFTVGPATAELARTLGFINISQGPGTAAGLAELVRRNIVAGNAPLICLTGEISAFDLGAALGADGYSVETAAVYRTVPAATLQPETLRGLAAAEIDAVLLMSARTAQTYVDLIQKHNQLDNIRKIHHLCLSDTVEKHLRPIGPLIIRTAAHPNVEELLALAGGAATSLR